MRASRFLFEKLEIGGNLLRFDFTRHIENRPAIATLVVVGVQRGDIGLLRNRQRRNPGG
jgi:hypothetical protein